MASLYRDFPFYLSTDLNLDLKVRIGTFTLPSWLTLPHSTGADDLYVTVFAQDGGIPLHSCARASRLPVRCTSDGSAVRWDEWLTVPFKIRDLPRTAQLVLELRGVGDALLGGTTTRLFDHELRLKSGLQKLVIWPSTSNKGEDATAAVTTTGSVPLIRSDASLAHLKALEAYELGGVQRCAWTDRLALAAVRSEMRACTIENDDALDPTGTEGPAFLTVHLPAFPHPVLFEDASYAGVKVPMTPTPLVQRWLGGRSNAGVGETMPGSVTGSIPWTPYWCESGILTLVHDPEIDADGAAAVDGGVGGSIGNPVEAKYHRLARGLLRGVADPNLKPNLEELARINEALNAPGILSSVDSADGGVGDLLWRFRYSLTGNKRALTRFLAAVDWDVPDDEREAVALLQRWAPIDVDDALRLLSADFSHRAVRAHGVAALRRAGNDELVLYLPQLVQALRYEPDLLTPRPAAADTSLSPLADLLISRALVSLEVANFLHWHLEVARSGDTRLGSRVFGHVLDELLAQLRAEAPSATAPARHAIAAALDAQAAFLTRLAEASAAATGSKKDSVAAKIDKLNTSLAPGGAYGDLCTLAEPIALPINPRLRTSGVHPRGCNIFKSALYPTVITFDVTPDSALDWTDARPAMAGLSVSDTAVAAARAAKAALVEARGGSSGGAAMDAADADAVVAAVAAATPPSPATYRLMFKNGDDMRQDQLIIQLITLMDAQLKRVGLDLRLTPYRVLATGLSSGMMELVLRSSAVSAVLKTYRYDVLAFFRAKHPVPGAEFGVDPEVLDTYVRSTAGYAVITYLLGIGDRHLDNILLRDDGHLFHVDFGYIFGRDPKPLPSPIRLTTEMIDGMGGPTSRNYVRFVRYCCQAYNVLRKSARLMLSLLSLMADAGIEALAEQPRATIAKVRNAVVQC